MSSASAPSSESDTTQQIQIAINTIASQDPVTLEDSNMSPTPTIHVLHDPHDNDNDDDVQMLTISEYDRKSGLGLIRQTQQPPLLHFSRTMSPTATMTSSSPSGKGTVAAASAMVLLKRQHSNNSNSSGSEEFLQHSHHQHQLLYQRSLSLSNSHSQELLGSTAPYPILTATRRGSAFTPYANTNLQLQQQQFYHRGSLSTSGFSGHGSSSVSSPLSTCSRHSITPPTAPTPTLTMQHQHLKSPNPPTATAAGALSQNPLTDHGSMDMASKQTMCSLKWKDYEAEILDTLSALYKSEEWADVTLSCEGHTVKAHKAILAMCSPFFRKMFQESPCKHPHVIVNGMKRREFERVIHFIYNGHVAINPDELDDFLDAAESLKIDGVHGGGWAAHSPDGPPENEADHEHERERDRDDADTADEFPLAPGSMYTHRLHRHRRNSSQSRSISDEYEHSLPVPFERLHLEEDDPDHRPHARRSSSSSAGSSFERDEESADKTMAREKEDNEQVVVVADEPDKDQQYPLNRLPKFQFKQRRHVGAAAGDEGKESGSGTWERRSTSSSISSGDTVVSSKTILDRGRPALGAETHVHFEQISPPSTPGPSADADADDEGDAPRTSKSLRLDAQFGVGADDRASPVDMSVGSRSSVLGPRPPPPPWYSPLSHKSQDESRRSRHSSDNDSIIEEPEIGEPSALHSHSPPYAAAVAAAVITHPSRASHFSQRHSLSHIYADAGMSAGAGRLGFSGDGSFMRRSLSLSPPENQSYQLHLPERREDGYNEPYSRAIEVMSSSNSFSSHKNLVPRAHLEDRRWMVQARAMGKRPFEISTTGVQRFSQAQAKESINAAFSPAAAGAFQFRGFGSPAYSTAPATTSSPSNRSKSPLYASGGHERNLNHNLQSYSAFMESGALAHLNDFQKYRFKTTNSGFGAGAGSQLRMQLSGIDSVGSSTRASSSSSSASVGGGGSGGGQFSSSAHNHSHSHQQQPMASSHRPGLAVNHSLSSLTKPRTKAIRSCQVPQEFRYTAQEVDSMVERVENYPGPLVPCAVCAKFVKRERLRAHIHECHLLQGEKIICQYCGIALKSKGSYRVHIWRHKRGNLPTKKFKPGAGAGPRRPSAQGQDHSEAASGP